jgi:hypothetical protein
MEVLRKIDLGAANDVSMWEAIDLEALGLKLALRGLHRGLVRQGVGGEGHACAELGLMYAAISLGHFGSFMVRG